MERKPFVLNNKQGHPIVFMLFSKKEITILESLALVLIREKFLSGRYYINKLINVLESEEHLNTGFQLFSNVFLTIDK
jgi:hypothetical protein